MGFDIALRFAVGATALNQVKELSKRSVLGVADRVVDIAKSRVHVDTGALRASIRKDEVGDDVFVVTETGYGGYEEMRGGDHAFMIPSLNQVQDEIASGKRFT